MLALVTGASSGIGEACARVFAAAGWSLILTARREERLEKLANELSSIFKVQVRYFALDVRNHQDVETLAKQNPDLISKVDVLVNNAGLARGLDPIQNGRLEDWDAMIDTNVKGLLYCTRTLLPFMIARKSGHIVNIGSIAGHWVYENGNVYCSTKFAVKALTEGMRLDLRGTGVRVTEISPGMVETEFSEVRLGDVKKAKAVYEGRDPLHAKDIAEAVLWAVNRPPHVNVQELVIFPTDQASVHSSIR